MKKIFTALFGLTEEEARDNPVDMEMLFTLHTAIDCIRYGKKSAGFLTDMPVVTAQEVAQYAYSVIMRFEDNYSESYQDEQGVWQRRGKGSMSLVTPLYIRLHKQAEAAMVYTGKVFKSGALTSEKLQAVLDYVQNNGPCPVTSIEGVKFSELDEGFKEYIAFQTNVAIGQATRTFKNHGIRNYRKSMLSAEAINDIINLKIYENGQMPQAPTPMEGEIIAFATDTTDAQSTSEIEVDATLLDPLITAQDNLALWWNCIDRTSDRRNLVDIMVEEARDFIKQKQDNPTQPGFVLAS